MPCASETILVVLVFEVPSFIGGSLYVKWLGLVLSVTIAQTTRGKPLLAGNVVRVFTPDSFLYPSESMDNVVMLALHLWKP